MSRIKGYYRFYGEKRARWLDTNTGRMHRTEFGPDHDARPFRFYDDAWRFNSLMFMIDPTTPEAADWYVLRFIPEGMFCGETRPAHTQCSGPYTEATARIQAANSTGDSRAGSRKVAVVQLLVGNTLSRVQPPAPAPVLVWS